MRLLDRCDAILRIGGHSQGADEIVNFFFPAEDGIRYLYVTGVQTCALPISIGCGSAVTLGPASVAVSPASIAQTIGATQQLTATVKDAGGNVLTGQSVTWT